MKVLCACEESQEVCFAFRSLGHEAFSCDIKPCSGGFPEWHIQADVSFLLSLSWDLIIAFPPCTYLSFAGNAHLSDPGRSILRDSAKQFFMLFVNAPCDHIAIENPLGFMSSYYRPPDQIVEPYFFGDPVKKRTCLWLKNLPVLVPSCLLSKPDPIYYRSDGKPIYFTEACHSRGGQSVRAAVRSKTFSGLAFAMAEQWSGLYGQMYF